MRKVCALQLLLMMALLFAPSKQAAQRSALVFTHVTIIDATGAPPSSDMTLVIVGDRIAELGKSEEIPLPQGAQIVDGSGKFLIPGLWDMHVHTLTRQRVEWCFPVFIANGILGVRDMGSPLEELEQINQWRQETAQGILLGPRIVAAGPLVDGSKPLFPDMSIAVANAGEGRQAVNILKQRGADFVKVYSLLPRDAYFAIAEEANHQGIPFAGHVPESVNAGEASDAGQRSIEHLSGILLACSTNETELRNELLAARAKSDPSLLYSALRHIQTKGKETYSDKKAEALFSQFVRNETWQVPTLTVAWTVASLNDGGLTNDPCFKKVLSMSPERRRLKTDSRFKDLTSGGSQIAFELVAAMRRAGVKFMAGTDAPNLWAYPGISLHEELALLVSAGLTPMEALESATCNPATYLGLQDSLGTVEKGKIADLVMLEANPLDDINNTRRISAVVVRGRLIGKSELQRMLSNVEVAADPMRSGVSKTAAE